MNVEKGSRMWEANAAAFRILRAHNEFNSNDDVQEFLKDVREFEAEYHEYANMFGGYFYIYGKMIENEWKERANG